ncbi:hypothetical protein BSLG_003732 [Batrachochytrium salamandrivorans]|nr:hypothetical protein BSLG_003732 [Batrachochytrium salamandrivorans]
MLWMFLLLLPAPVVDQCTMGMGASGSTDSMNSMNSLSSSHEEIGTTTVNPTNCINLTWHQVDQLSRTVLPPTFIEYAIRISAVLLCLVSLLHSARFPASAAPRSLAIFYLPYIMTQAFVMAHMTLMDLSVDSLFCLQAIAGFLACICFGLDICNPSRNAAIIEKAHVQKRSLPGQETASFLSLITFSWVVPLLKAGREKPLESDDIPHIPQYDHMDQVVQRWKRIRIKGNNVFWDILRMTYKYATFQILVSIVTSCSFFLQPFLYQQDSNLDSNSQTRGWLDMGALPLLGMLVSSLLMDILNSQINLSGRHWGIQLRSVLVYEVFKKSTRRAGKTGSASKEASGKDDDNSASQGKIVSLMSTDTRHVRNFITDIHSLLIDTPLSIVLSDSQANTVTQDRRIQATNEALLGIRIIKYMAWEMQFLKKIVAAREDELQSRLKLLINNLCMILIAWGSSILVTFTSFFFYTVVAGKSLDAATAFTSISLLSTVSFNLSSLSEDVSRILNVRVVMARLHAFLTEEELERYHTVDEKVPQGTNSRQASKSTTERVLGSGMPSSAIIRLNRTHLPVLIYANMPTVLLMITCLWQPLYSRQTPDAIARGSSQTNLAYVAQTAWLLNATIRDNILFGAPYEEERYSRVVTACALRRDLETFQGGDLTEIGEKGVNLSGGQKQRVSLARAAYSRAQIVLLDDPLSAVDAPTARQLFYECILDLFKGRTVLLVTHAVGLTALQSDHVILLKNGQVFLQGTPLDIIANPDVGTILGKDMESNMPTYETATEDSNDTNGKCAIKSDAKSGKRLTDREGKATGSVKWVTYTAYIVACGGFVFLFFVFLGFFIQTAADFMSNCTVSAYSSMVSTLSPDITMLEQSTKDALFYISIYGLISMIELFSLVFKFVVQFFGGMRISRVMHARLIEAVLDPYAYLFRIINRFSTDLSDIDMAVMFTVVRFFTLTCGAVVRIGLVTFVTPPFLFSVVFLYFYYNIAQYYLLTSRELKRIESVSSSPIYAQFGETLNGVSTIRAYGAEDRITQQIQRKVDANHRAYFYLFATNRWLSLRTSVLSEAIVFGAGISIILSGGLAGWAGVAFIFANQFTSMMSRMIQIHSSMEMAMNAVERVEEYSKLPQEPPAIIELFRPPANWPTHGRTGAGKSTLSTAFFRILPFVNGTITIDGVDISRLGLRDLRSCLTIIPQDPVLFEGTLRSNLDPLDEHADNKIWEALLHSNLLESLQKPKEKRGAMLVSSDEEDVASGSASPTSSAPALWDGLTNSGTNQKLSLDAHVSEMATTFLRDKNNFYVLLRALLRSRRVIFLDEATASVDTDTDVKIQQTIRTQFTDATVLTVAHRLKTVIDYDRVLVMDAGQVAEIGTPYELLEQNGVFASMCRESGDYEQLVEMATACHKARLLIDV